MLVSLCEETKDSYFGDKRLSDRLQKIAEEFGKQPNLSIPGATSGRAEMEAAYRFFDNPKVTAEKILQPHYEASLNRIKSCDFVLLVQDSTELDLTRPNQQVTDAGPLDCEKRRGAFYHPLQAFDLNGVPLGAVWHHLTVREKIDKTLTPKEKDLGRKKIPIEEKESLRWLEGLRATNKVAQQCPETTCVCVGDSESDIYELFSEPKENDNLHLLIRACQNRSTRTGDKWIEDARATSCLYQCTVSVSARTAKLSSSSLKLGKRKKSRKARLAEVEVRATTVTLKAVPRFDRKLPDVRINVVLAEEVNPPEGCDAIQWILVTTLPIENLNDVRQIVDAYCIRWQIEIFFKTMKTGCRIEERQFKTLRRLINCMAVYSIVAWRVMYLCRLGRTCPDLTCEVIFEACEWKAVCMMTNRNKPLPEKPPTLNQVIRMIASLGGYVIRTKTQPGPQTLWIGMQRLHDLALAWKAFGPDS